MAHTDNTVPYRLWAQYGLTFNSPMRAFLDSQHHSKHKDEQREFNRRDRHNARAALRHGEQPDPIQPRGRAIYDAW